MRFAGSPQIASFMNSKMDFGDTAQAGQKANAEQRISATQADAAVGRADIEANAMLEAAKLGAEATAAQADAAKQSSIFGGIGSAVSGIAGGLFSGGGGGGTDFGKLAGKDYGAFKGTANSAYGGLGGWFN